jgi:predicted permease
METFLQDLKYSIRGLQRNPGFTLAAVAALALGIGANTAIFSVVNSILLKPAPFRDPDRIMLLMTVFPQGSGAAGSPAKFLHWRQQESVLQDVTAYRTGAVNLTGDGQPEQLRSAQVSAAYFRLFGAPAILGRTFTPEEDLPRGEKVVVLSHGFWERRYASDPQIIGKRILLGGDPHVVIGIIGPDFDFRDLGPAPEVWVPFQLELNTGDQGHYFQLAGRLKPGVSVAQANARMKIATAEFEQKYPKALGENAHFGVEPLRDALVRNVRPTLWVLVGAVSFVLLIACANVANLLLARAISRRREIAVRAAIGAGRARLIRQQLTESVLLSSAGTLAGSAIGVIGIRTLLTVNTANLPRVGQEGSLVGVDWRVLLFTVLAALVTALLFGLLPALQISRADLASTMKEAGGRSGTGFRHNKARTMLVVGEIGLALVLVVGSALLIRTMLALSRVNPGFKAENVLTMRMSLASERYYKTAEVERLITEGVTRLRNLPGVITASATCCVPLEGGYGLGFRIMGRPLEQRPFHGGGSWLTVSPGYFDVFRIPLIGGRTFNERDTAAADPVVIVNQAFARQYWPKTEPLGERILIGKGTMSELSTEQPRQIVGIVGDVRGALDRQPGPVMYIPNAQVPDALNALNVRLTPLKWVLHTQGSPHTLSAAVQEQLRQASGLPVSDIRTMDEVVSRSTSRQQFNMLLMGVFGGVALFLAAIGIYGLMAYSVQQQTQEIGIRLALGAETGDMRRMVVFQGMRLAVTGIGLGLAAAFGLTRVISSFLFGVAPRDPLVLVAVPLTLAAVSLFAVWIPAARATRIDPAVTLRYE